MIHFYKKFNSADLKVHSFVSIQTWRFIIGMTGNTFLLLGYWGFELWQNKPTRTSTLENAGKVEYIIYYMYLMCMCGGLVG